MPEKPVLNNLASDNTSCACPEVMDAVIAANSGIASSYGDDACSLRLDAVFTEIFETEVRVFQIVSGTAANALALSALTPSPRQRARSEQTGTRLAPVFHFHTVSDNQSALFGMVPRSAGYAD